MEQLQIFKNVEFGEIRTLTINGEPWLVGKDVAVALGYTNPQKAIRDHVDVEDKTLNELFTVNGTQGILINESGFYSLVLSSKLPSAKKFKRWVTSEVLPSIRKNGGYIANQENLTDDELMAKALLVAQNKIRRTKKMNKIREEIENNLFDMESLLELMNLPQYQDSEVLHRRYEELKLDTERLNRELRKTA